MIQPLMERWLIYNISSSRNLIGDHYGSIYGWWLHSYGLLRFEFLPISVYRYCLIRIDFDVQIYIYFFLLFWLWTHHFYIWIVWLHGFPQMWGSLNFGGSNWSEGWAEGGTNDILMIDC